MAKKEVKKQAKKVAKPKKKLHTYTYKLYSRYGYVRARNMTDAICKAVRRCYGDTKDTLVRFDMLVKKGRHEVY